MAFICEVKDAKGKQCGKPLETEAGLKMHKIKVHKIFPDDNLTCRIEITQGMECGMEFSRRLLYLHNRIWHQEVECSHASCDQRFPHKRLMFNHYDIEHRKKWWCSRRNGCSYNTKIKEEIIKHKMTCAFALQPVRRDEGGEENGEPCQVMVKTDEPCGMVVTRNQRHNHDRVWHQEVKCRDKSCDSMFAHKKLMLQHYDQEHKSFWSCKNRKDGCFSRFTNADRLAAHELNCEPKEKRYTCGFDECDAKFMSIASLKIHLYLTHSLSALECQEHIGINEDDETDSEDDEDVTPSKQMKFQEISIPLDPETGAVYELFKFGIPEWRFLPLKYDLFWIFYHYGLRVPIFTFQLLHPALLSSKKPLLARPHFRLDRSLPKIFRRGKKHYDGLYMHRGHMVRYTDYSLLPITAQNTFLYSNILPMFPNFNQSAWSRVENATADFARAHTITFVITVALFSEPLKTAGPKDLPMPNSFSKIMLGLNPDTKRWDLRTYTLPHDETVKSDTSLSQLLGDLEEIESQLKVKLFPNLRPDQLGTIQQRSNSQEQAQYIHEKNVIELH